MSTNKTIWVVIGISESGDEYGPETFKEKPTDEILKELVRNWDAGDWNGPGAYNSYVHLKTTECEIK